MTHRLVPKTIRLRRAQSSFTLLTALSVCGILAASTPAEKLLNQTGENLVANGNFTAKDPEQRPLRWVSGPGLQTAILTLKEPHSAIKDDASLELSDASATESVSVRSEKRIANPGTAYVASAWAKIGSGSAAALSIEFWDQNAKCTGTTSVVPAANSEWQQIAATLVAPDNTTHVTVSIASSREAVGISYWDDVDLTADVPYEPHLAEGTRELFLDDYRVDSLQDVQRIVHPGKKSPPLITPTEPWEGNSVYIYGTVLKDQPQGSGYRMWYTAYSDRYYLCYATSDDGLTWRKPKLGIIEFKGSRENNIVYEGGGTLVYDPDASEAGQRYKMLTFRGGPKEIFGYWTYVSPDGFHWTPHGHNPVISYGDVSALAFDQKARIFIATTKQRMIAANTSVTPGKQDRAAFVSVSTNFLDWTAPGAPRSPWTLAVEGDHTDDYQAMARNRLEAQIYGMPIYPYEGIYIGLPWVFEISSYATGRYAETGDGPIQPQIAVSRDLRHWSRPVRDPVLPLGTAGSWDDGTLYTASTFLVSPTEIELYFGAMNLGHGADTGRQIQFGRIARATWRRDGFISLHNGGADTGIINTKTVMFSRGSTLHVNVHLQSGGALKVEFLNQADEPLPGFSLSDATAVSGDQLDAIIHWNGKSDIGALAGQSVKMRFHLQEGDLYSYRFD